MLPPPSSSRHHPSFPDPILPFRNSYPAPPSKKRKVDRACDACRRRKTRCDGPQSNDSVCTNCKHAHRHCTYLEASKPRGPPKAYINGLEDRMEKMDALLKRLRPDIDFSKELGPPVIRDSWKKEASHSESPSDIKQEHSPSSSSSFASHPSRNAPKTAAGYHSDVDYMAEDEYPSPDEEDPYEAELTRTIETMDKRLKLTEFEPSEKSDRRLDRRLRYHGSSSPILLATAAQEHRLKHLEAFGVKVASLQGTRPPGTADKVWEGLHRAEYWKAPEWELKYEGLFLTSNDFPELAECWPEPDLASALIDLYFRYFNSMFPLLHRPTFDRQYADRLYKHDVWYACVCLGVFVIASRHIEDPRVLFVHPKYRPDKSQSIWHSAGIKYYYVIMRVLLEKKSIMTPSSLFEVQTICLSTHFQRDTCWQGGAWTSVASAIRKVQDIGGHRKRSYQLGHTVENELWKRAWWFIVGMDRTGSATMGRPCSTSDEDMDVELPLDVDDEFWESEDLTQAFRQPPERPSLVKAFILWLRLTEIAAEVINNFYVANESKALIMKRPEQPNDVLKRLNTKVTEWIESVPDYLKWSPDIQDPIIANQSATLFLNYNLITILLQRAFLPPTLARIRGLGSPYRQSIPGYPQALTSLAIAVNSAKAGTRVLDVARRRGLPNVPLFLSSSDVFAAVLCLDVWVLKVQEKTLRLNGEDPSFETMQKIEALMADLHTIIQAVEAAVPRWESAQYQAIYLKQAFPSSEDEPADWDDVQLEVMPPLDGEDHTRTAGFVTSPTHFGQHHPFYVEHEASPSVASSTATHAPIAPSFPSHSPTAYLPPTPNFGGQPYYLKHEGTSRSVFSQPGFARVPSQPPIPPSSPSLRPQLSASQPYPMHPPPPAACDTFTGPPTLYPRQSGDVGSRPDARAVGSFVEPSRGSSAYQGMLPHVKLEDQDFGIGLNPSTSVAVAATPWTTTSSGEHPYGRASGPRGFSWNNVRGYAVASMTPQDPRYFERDPEQVFSHQPM